MTSQPAGSKYSAHEIIGMFKELNLLVCDDRVAIEQKFNDKKPFYLSLTRKADPRENKKGEDGIKHGTELMQKLPELLEVVYHYFVGLADTALSGAYASGMKKMTRELSDNLHKTILVENCRVCDSLAKQWLDRYLHEKHLVVGEILPPIGAQIEDFKANSRLGEIFLSWKKPAERCDLVEIIRSAKKKSDEKVIYRGDKDTTCLDGASDAGVWVEYRAHSIYQNEPGSDSVVRAVRLAEVSALEAIWQKSAMQVSWKKPSKEPSVLVFRRLGGVPRIFSGNDQPAPANSETYLIYSGPAESCKDSGLQEGEIYFYTVVCLFEKGLFTQGISVQAPPVPKPPPPPQGFSASYLQNNENHAVNLSWISLEGDQVFEYLVVRNEGSTRPGSPADGKVLVEFDGSTYSDRSVEPGKRYTYAIFTRIGDLVSRSGASAPAVDILAEVSSLVAQSGSQTIELTWQEPPAVSEIMIYRQHATTGRQPLRPTSRGYLRDDDLENGQEYLYEVLCRYTIAGKPIDSTGLTIQAIPEELPEPAQDLELRVEGLEIVCEWEPPSFGSVVALRTTYPPEWTLHQRLKASEVERLDGERIHVEGNRAVDSAPIIERPHYSFFSISGRHAVYCGVRVGLLIQDVTDLRLSVSSDGVFLRWTWPTGCTTVRIVRSQGQFACGVEDPQAVSTIFSRWEYSAAGDKYFDRIEGLSGRFCYTVYAQASSNAGQFFSPGINPGCQAEVERRPWMTLRYQIEPVTSGPQKGKTLSIRWNVLDPAPGFAGFVLVASQSAIPASEDDGIVLHRWRPAADFREGNYREEVSLAPVQDRRWAHFFLKLFCSDPAQRHFTLVWHPNTSLWYLPDGIQATPSQVEMDKKGRTASGYLAGIPEKVICPYCFEEFPPEEMFFTSYAGGTPVKAKYSRMDRILHKPIPVPTDSQGRRLTVRLCPNNPDHVLPYTAGLQSSLVIGMIGARKSGKSHYIATLIDRLYNQVGADMHAALLEVTEETAKRYRTEFYEPLYKNKLELPFTIGAPPPLIFDLTLEGSLWGEKQNRAVTLAFYDTAGENLQDPATARQMVQYLSKASGVIFLVDPLQSTAIRQALPESIVPPEADTNASPNRIIANVLQLLEEGRVLDANAPISVPVAMVMNKCDVLVDTGMIETNRLWSSEFRHVGSFDPLALEDMNGMMAEYFQRWNPDAYNNIRLRFARHAFFGASATGCAADPLTRRFRYISPWRVEDPLLWLLAELNVIPKRI